MSSREGNGAAATAQTPPQALRRSSMKNMSASLTIGNDFLGDHLGQLLGRHPNSGRKSGSSEQRQQASRSDQGSLDFLGTAIATASRPSGNKLMSPEASRNGSFITSARGGSVMSTRNLSNDGSPTYTVHGRPFGLPAPCDELFGSFFSDKTSMGQPTSPEREDAAESSTSRSKVETKRVSLDRRSSSFVYAPSRRPKKSTSSNDSPDAKSRSDWQSDASSALGRDSSDCVPSDKQSTSSRLEGIDERRTPSVVASEAASVVSTPASSLQTYDFWQTQAAASRLTLSTLPTDGDARSSQGDDKWVTSRHGSLDSANGANSGSDEARSTGSDKPPEMTYSRALQHFRDGGVIEPPEAENGPEALSFEQADDMLKLPTFALSHPGMASSPSDASATTAPTLASRSTASTALTSASSRYTSMTSSRGSFSSSDPRKSFVMLSGGSVSQRGSAIGAADSTPTPAAMSNQSSSPAIPKHFGGDRLVPKGGADDDGRTFVFVSR